MDGKQSGDTLRKNPVAESSSARRSRSLLAKRIDLDRFTCFAFLLGCQALAHQGSFGVLHLLTDPVWWATNLCIVLLILRPSSIALLTAALVLNVGASWRDLPYTSNHILFEDIVNLTILSAIAIAWLRHRRGRTGRQPFNTKERRAEILQLFAPAVRISLILLYFFVTLAKLNDDFFDRDVSCAAEMCQEIVPLDLTSSLLSWMPTVAIYGSLLAEGGIPILLLFKATRALGVVAGLGFHLVLAFHPHGGVFGFSSMMFTLLFLFTGEGFTATLNSHLNRLRERLDDRHDRRRHAAWALLGGLLTVVLAVILGQARMPFSVWLIWALVLIAGFLFVLFRTPSDRRSFDEPLFSRPILLYFFPVLVVLNGAAPYLGLKTETSFSMFSNLRTEDGETNHFFIPVDWQLATYQKGLVEITTSDLPEFRELAENGDRLTRFEFERMLHIQDNFTVSCECYGTTLRISKEDGAISGFNQEEGYSHWLGKVLYFREISQSDTSPCAH